MKLRDLIVKIKGDSSSYNKELDKAGQKTSKFGASMKKIGGLIAGAFAVQKVTAFFKESFKLYGIQIQAERSLGAAIANNGKIVQTTLDDYKRYASGIQRITTIGDEAVLKLLQLAESMQSAAPKEAATAAIALSKAYGIDLQSAIKMVILAENSEYTMLQRYIPALRTVNTDAEKRAILERAVAGGMKIATSEMEDQTGKIKQLGNAWGDFMEGVGQVMADIGDATGATNRITESISDMGDVLKNRNIPIWKRLIGVFGNLSGLGNALFELLNLQTKAQGIEAENTAKKNEKIVKSLDLEHKSLSELRTMLTEVARGSDFAYKKVTIPAIQEAIKAIVKQRTELEKLKEAQKVSGKLKSTGIIGVDTADAPSLGGIIDISQFSGSLDAAEQRMADFNDTMLGYAEDFNNSVVAGFSDGMQELANQLMAGNLDAGPLVAALLTPLADMAIRAGEIIIATGTALEWLKKAMANLLGSGPAGAIMAGVALIAIGATAKAGLSAIASGGGGGGTSSRQGGSGLQATPVTGGSSIIQGGESVTGLKGDQAVIPSTITLIASGNDLKAVLDRNTKRKGSY